MSLGGLSFLFVAIKINLVTSIIALFSFTRFTRRRVCGGRWSDLSALGQNLKRSFELSHAEGVWGNVKFAYSIQLFHFDAASGRYGSVLSSTPWPTANASGNAHLKSSKYPPTVEQAR